LWRRPGAGGDEVEDLDDLGAQAAREMGVAAERVLAGHATLLVSGGAQGEPGDAEQPVMGVHAVTGGEDVGQVGTHGFVDNDGAFDAQVRPGIGGKFCVGADADHN
jgi:hypothetical protein